ncbi:MAG: hypothetical protein V3V32_04485 [Dehalococcoidia bacterium]
MARLVPLVEIELDRPRFLRFDLNAMCEVERMTGSSFAEMDGSMQTMRVLLWAGLLHDDPELTLKDVGSFIHVGNIQEVSDAVGEALSVAMPGDRAAAADGDAAKNPNGSTG